jgi:hypothetical protein
MTGGLEKMKITTIGPITKTRRDEVKDLRDSLEHENYNETLGYLLENLDHNAIATDD